MDRPRCSFFNDIASPVSKIKMKVKNNIIFTKTKEFIVNVCELQSTYNSVTLRLRAIIQ